MGRKLAREPKRLNGCGESFRRNYVVYEPLGEGEHPSRPLGQQLLPGEEVHRIVAELVNPETEVSVRADTRCSVDLTVERRSNHPTHLRLKVLGIETAP